MDALEPRLRCVQPTSGTSLQPRFIRKTDRYLPVVNLGDYGKGFFYRGQILICPPVYEILNAKKSSFASGITW